MLDVQQVLEASNVADTEYGDLGGTFSDALGAEYFALESPTSTFAYTVRAERSLTALAPLGRQRRARLRAHGGRRELHARGALRALPLREQLAGRHTGVAPDGQHDAGR